MTVEDDSHVASLLRMTTWTVLRSSGGGGDLASLFGWRFGRSSCGVGVSLHAVSLLFSCGGEELLVPRGG